MSSYLPPLYAAWRFVPSRTKPSFSYNLRARLLQSRTQSSIRLNPRSRNACSTIADRAKAPTPLPCDFGLTMMWNTHERLTQSIEAKVANPRMSSGSPSSTTAQRTVFARPLR